LIAQLEQELQPEQAQESQLALAQESQLELQLVQVLE
jgi:hypothetical protein